MPIGTAAPITRLRQKTRRKTAATPIQYYFFSMTVTNPRWAWVGARPPGLPGPLTMIIPGVAWFTSLWGSHACHDVRLPNSCRHALPPDPRCTSRHHNCLGSPRWSASSLRPMAVPRTSPRESVLRSPITDHRKVGRERESE